MRHKQILTGQRDYDKRACEPTFHFPGFQIRRELARRRAVCALAALKIRRSKKRKNATFRIMPEMYATVHGYDPELLYVECGRCGAPVIWENGKATELLDQAGIDPVEIDSSCLLVTDGCPSCGTGSEYGVRIFRIASQIATGVNPLHGHA